VPDAPERVEASGSGPTETAACQAAKDAAQALSPWELILDTANVSAAGKTDGDS